MALPNFTLLDGDWPILETFTPLTDEVFASIKASADGLALSEVSGHLSLGTFLIHTNLLVPHKSQRPVVNSHADELKDAFKDIGIFRGDNPGVIIGLGSGWLQMKNTGPVPYKITDTCPHLSLLSSEENGPIGQVIRGGHRTEAIKRFAAEFNSPDENYWLYKVLIPGIS